MSGGAHRGSTRLARAAAALAAVAAVVMLATLVLLGREVGWVVYIHDARQPDGIWASDLRGELPWHLVLGVGVLVGAYLAVRRPRHPIPWLLMALGIGFLSYPATVIVTARAVADGTVPAWTPYVAWIGNWSWVVGQVGGIYLLFLFPDGRPLSPRWRVVARTGAVYIAAVFLLVAAWPRLEAVPALIGRGPDLVEPPPLTNPFGLEALSSVEPVIMPIVLGFPLLLVLGAVNLVLRFVRSVGVERLQMKWMAFAAAFLGVMNIAIMAGLPRWLQAVSTAMVLAAILVAVTRYRLYEIDRIISRTVTYAVVSLVLVGVYVSGVLGLGTVIRAFTGDGGGDLVVAASTLAVAALFQPVRRRVRTVVDRRFNRSRYDAARTVGSFAARLRDEVDLDVLGSEIRTVADRALRPAHVSLVLVGGDQRVDS